MDQDLSTNPVAPVKTFDEIKISLAPQERIVGLNLEFPDAEEG